MTEIPLNMGKGLHAFFYRGLWRSLVSITLVSGGLSACSQVAPPDSATMHPATPSMALPAAPLRVPSPSPRTRTPTGLAPGGLAALPAGEYLLVIRSEERLDPQREEWLSLFALSLDGALGPVIASDIGSDAALSRDGALLAFLAEVPADSGGRHLVVVDLWTGDRVQALAGFGRAHVPSWSPDSSRLALSMGGDLYVVALNDGSLEKALSCTGIPGGGCGGPQWSPDGEYLAYVFDLSRSGPPDPSEGVYVLNTRCIAGGPGCEAETIGPISTANGPWEWAPDGRLLAVGSYDGSVELYSSGTWALERTLATSQGLDVNSLAWSPDGEWMALALGPDMHISRISLASGEEIPVYEGGNVRRLVAWISVGSAP